jgi:uncharacterized OB-fold protein
MTPGDDVVLASYPAIRLDGVNRELYRGYLRHQLVAGHCADCERWHTPLRPICPSCWSPRVQARPVRGVGSIYAITLLHQGPPVVSYSPPWPLAAIELIEQSGLRVAATLVDTPAEQQRVGVPVELVWIDRDGAPWPAFRAVAERIETS